MTNTTLGWLAISITFASGFVLPDATEARGGGGGRGGFTINATSQGQLQAQLQGQRQTNNVNVEVNTAAGGGSVANAATNTTSNSTNNTTANMTSNATTNTTTNMASNANNAANTASNSNGASNFGNSEPAGNANSGSNVSWLFGGGGGGYGGGFNEQTFVAPAPLMPQTTAPGPMEVMYNSPFARPQALGSRQVVTNGIRTTVTEPIVTEYVWPSQMHEPLAAAPAAMQKRRSHSYAATAGQ